jgi:predicted phage terminase large subunit-like protein
LLSVDEIAECRTDLLAFTKTMFKAVKGSDFVENWHHREICEVLERVVIGDITRLIINIPPRYSKTELAVINFIAWTIGNFPDSEFIHASYGARLAESNTSRVKSMVENPVYKEIFAEFELSRDAKAKSLFQTTSGGRVYSDGAGGSLTGHGAGKISEDGLFHGAIIIDDIQKPSEANSTLVREGVNNWYTETLMSRTNDKKTPIINIQQRLHESDLSGFLLDGGSGEEWHHLRIPAVHDDTGEALWEFKHNKEDLERLKEVNPYGFAGQYLQLPAPIGGGIFRDSYWQYYEDLPVIHSKRIYADTALKTKEENDFSVFQCWGKSKEGQIYLIDQLRGKWEAPELEINARAFYNKHKSVYATVNAFKIEDKASGIGLIQSLRREGIPIVPIPREKDKVTRAHDCTGLLASANVYLPKNWEGLSNYLSEFSSFPNAKHDDQVDPTMDAIEDLLRNEPIDYGAMFK